MKALERLKNHSNNIKQFKGVSYDSEQSFVMSNYLNLAIQALEEKLEREKNKPLELSELKEMVGEPVWIESENPIHSCWEIIEEVPRMNKDNTTFLLYTTSGGYYKSGRNLFYKHKPNGEK